MHHGRRPVTDEASCAGRRGVARPVHD
jgi:hypothetical protein